MIIYKPHLNVISAALIAHAERLPAHFRLIEKLNYLR